MRQFFKLEQAYVMMREFEASVGWRFDHVCKSRTDIPSRPPLDHKLFTGPQYQSKPNLNSRDVAEDLLFGLTDKFKALAGVPDEVARPLNAQQLLQSELQDNHRTDASCWLLRAALVRPLSAIPTDRIDILYRTVPEA
eukprot:2947848-Amphidinium_carterae.1